jgi:tetratricopeptide (TPR) repeat protein
VIALAGLTVTFAGLAIWAEFNRREAELQRQRAVASLQAATKTSNSLIYDPAMRFREQTGVPSALVKDILGHARSLQDDLAQSGQSSPELRHSQASALSEAALTLLSIGDPSGALDTANKSREILESLLTENSDDAAVRLDLGVVRQRIGDALVSAGDRDEALESYEKARELHAALVAADAGNDRAQQNLAADYSKIGDLFVENKPDEALVAYQNNLSIMKRLTEHDQRRADWWRDLGVAYERLGLVLAQQGKLNEALPAFQHRLDIAQALVNDGPGNTESLRNLSVASNKIGDILLAQAKPDDALNAYRRGMEIRKKSADMDPANMVWSRDLAISHNLIGTALTSVGKFDDAFAELAQGLSIERSLVAKDAGNVLWQRDLYTSEITIGRLLARQDKTDAALASFREGLAVAMLQARTNPGDAEWGRFVQFGAVNAGYLAHDFVLAREYPQALQAADLAIAATPDQIWLRGERAHALMFLDRTDEARDLYLKYRGTKSVREQKSWEGFILGNFADFRSAGLEKPLMNEIAARFAGDH